MNDNVRITQKSALGSETTQIATQNNYYGLTPAEAGKLAINLFMENFPKLQDEALKTVQNRVEEFIQETVSKIEAKYGADFSAFSKLVLSLDMLAGRLELYPILVLFTSAAWRKSRYI